MRNAVIDLGTNTFHLIVADVTSDEVIEIFRKSTPVKLGEDAMKTGMLTKSAIARGIAALLEFKALANFYQANSIKAVGTSAIRSAQNGTEFVAKALRETGISIDVISGEEEAQLIYQGVRSTGIIKRCSLIVDIGGGSTEFIVCNEMDVQFSTSLNIGAARLMQHFFHSDPLSSEDANTISLHLRKEMKEVVDAIKKFKPEILIGSAGAFETFSDLTSAGNTIEINALNALLIQLVESSHVERLKTVEIPEIRKDMIVMAALIVQYVLACSQIRIVKLSRADLKIGVLHGQTR